MKKVTLIVGAAMLVLVGLFTILSQGSSSQQNNSLVPASDITHSHGLAVDVSDSSKLYIATHYGLMVLQNDKDLYRVGNKKDDYMGFTPHPSDSKVFFSSGHPSFGGNLGFQKSTDAGFNWGKISNGVTGPVDFHALTVSGVNPDLLYGWYRGRLQRSTDGGKNWEIIQTNLTSVISLTADPKNEGVVYAATNQGLIVSNNKGIEWSPLGKELNGGLVPAFAVNPQDSTKMLAYSEKQGLLSSGDSGLSWTKVALDTSGDLVLYLAYAKMSPQTIYALTQGNSIYKSVDEGKSWAKIR